MSDLIPPEGVRFLAFSYLHQNDDAAPWTVGMVLSEEDESGAFAYWFDVEYADGSVMSINGALNAKRPATVDEVLSFLRTREGLHMPEVDAASERQENTAETTPDVYLRVAHEDVLDVFERTGTRIGQVAPSADGWAAYAATLTGRILPKRVGTVKDIQDAVDLVIVTTQVNLAE